MKFKASFSTQGDCGRRGPSTHHMEITAERKKDLDHYTACSGKAEMELPPAAGRHNPDKDSHRSSQLGDSSEGMDFVGENL